MHTDTCYFLSPHKNVSPRQSECDEWVYPAFNPPGFISRNLFLRWLRIWNVNLFFFFNCSPKFLPCPSSKLVRCVEPRFSEGRACPTFWWNVLFECVTEIGSFLETRIWWLSRRGLLGRSSVGTNPTGICAQSHLQPEATYLVSWGNERVPLDLSWELSRGRWERGRKAWKKGGADPECLRTV